jgi:hypothetical protein
MCPRCGLAAGALFRNRGGRPFEVKAPSSLGEGMTIVIAITINRSARGSADNWRHEAILLLRYHTLSQS